MNHLKVSLIITTYNWPDALQLVLQSVANQNLSFNDFEVIIADDGSKEETRKLIEHWQAKFQCALKHVWQADKGFRAAKIRNQAVKMAAHDYIIFIDGDCVLGSCFLKRHIELAQKNWFVFGNRVLLNQTITSRILNEQLPIYQYNLYQWLRLWQQKKINRISPFFVMPLGPLRKLGKRRWQGAKTCNLALWRRDFVAVNGFDESYEGWGFEDSDLVIRLINKGVYRKQGRFSVPVYHLYHREESRKMADSNYNILLQTQLNKKVWATTGLCQNK